MGNMTDQSALAIAKSYFEAWTSKDIAAAMSYLAEDFVCDAPAGRIEGIDAYREFLGPFTEILLGAELIAAFGDVRQAVLVYDTRTVPVSNAPGAECMTIVDGKITYSRFIFDRLPFDQARRPTGNP
jgi:ketosteroid isomerase-like protein